MEPLDPKAELMRACEQADWVQVSLNCMHGGRPCFHLADDGDFCLRHETWAGHDISHKFTTLSAAITLALAAERRRALIEAWNACKDARESAFPIDGTVVIRALIDAKAGGPTPPITQGESK